MEHHVRVMDVYPGLGKCFQNGLAQIAVDLHGGPGVRFLRPAGLHLEGQVLIRIHFIHISHNVLLQLVESPILHADYRTDPHQAEHAGQVLHRLLIVVFSHAVHIDPGLGFVYFEFPVHICKGTLHLAHQGVFKKIPVLSLDPDLSVFQ